jgi:hypothetical protein
VVHIVVAGYVVDHYCLRFDREVVHIGDHYCFMFDRGVVHIVVAVMVNNIASHNNMNDSSVKHETVTVNNITATTI